MINNKNKLVLTYVFLARTQKAWDDNIMLVARLPVNVYFPKLSLANFPRKYHLKVSGIASVSCSTTQIVPSTTQLGPSWASPAKTRHTQHKFCPAQPSWAPAGQAQQKPVIAQHKFCPAQPSITQLGPSWASPAKTRAQHNPATPSNAQHRPRGPQLGDAGHVG